MNFGKSTYQSIFEPYALKTVGYFRLHGNWGDHLIEQGALALFRDFNINVKVVNPDYFRFNLNILSEVDTIFMAGGGSLGHLYKHNYELRTELLRLFKGSTVFLPQSMTDENDRNPYSFVWLREAMSFEKWQGPKGACHDLAFYLNFDNYKKILPTEKIGVLCRVDEEAQGKIESNLGDPVKLSHSVEDYINLAAKYEEIITDRIHFAIIAAKLGRKVKLFAGNYYKNKAIYEFSLKHFSNVSFYDKFEDIS